MTRRLIEAALKRDVRVFTGVLLPETGDPESSLAAKRANPSGE